MNISWKPLVRDVAIVWVAQNLGGFVIGLTGALLGGRNAMANPRIMVALAMSNFVFGTVAFTIVGALAKRNRFTHLPTVALIVWLLAAPAVLYMPITLGQWFLGGLVSTVLVMLIGGALSFLFSPPSKTPSSGV